MSRILLVTFSGCKFGISKVVCNWDLDSCCYRVSVFFFAVISDWCIFFLLVWALVSARCSLLLGVVLFPFSLGLFPVFTGVEVVLEFGL
jgi:hypothetical protein